MYTLMKLISYNTVSLFDFQHWNGELHDVPYRSEHSQQDNSKHKKFCNQISVK